ncbi:hypothetical protein NLU13_8874 [Sarocladium strictum]|uniref:Uncharacterized protein n=1 Tax=Sarocladium strictum TaxID=5046 RepID=A0AA39G941_SARSR|nr:hypothetical protein NLU13_8874 [Sarocladium strictum]
MSRTSDLSVISQSDSQACPTGRCVKILKVVNCPPCRTLGTQMVGMMRCSSLDAWTHHMTDDVQWDRFQEEDWTIAPCDDCIAKGHPANPTPPVREPTRHSDDTTSDESSHSRAIVRSLAASALNGTAASDADGEDADISARFELFAVGSESGSSDSASCHDPKQDRRHNVAGVASNRLQLWIGEAQSLDQNEPDREAQMIKLWRDAENDEGARTPTLLQSDASSSGEAPKGAESLDQEDSDREAQMKKLWRDAENDQGAKTPTLLQSDTSSIDGPQSADDADVQSELANLDLEEPNSSLLASPSVSSTDAASDGPEKSDPAAAAADDCSGRQQSSSPGPLRPTAAPFQPTLPDGSSQHSNSGSLRATAAPFQPTLPEAGQPPKRGSLRPNACPFQPAPPVPFMPLVPEGPQSAVPEFYHCPFPELVQPISMSLFQPPAFPGSPSSSFDSWSDSHSGYFPSLYTEDGSEDGYPASTPPFMPTIYY